MPTEGRIVLAVLCESCQMLTDIKTHHATNAVYIGGGAELNMCQNCGRKFHNAAAIIEEFLRLATIWHASLVVASHDGHAIAT